MRTSQWIAATALMFFGSVPTAMSITPAENRYARYAQVPLPHCASSEVTGYVASWFESRERIYWNSSLSIRGFDRIRETGVRPWGADFVPRRFCTARVHTSDGRMRRANYFVRESISMFGNTWEVIWCVTGTDRHWTYAPACEQATQW